MRDGRIFTTGEIAAMCGVAPRTVSQWMERGILKGYRIPGSQDRRFPRANLIAFLEKSGMPLPPELSGTRRVLLVGATVGLMGMSFRDADWEAHQVGCAFSAGLAAAELRPDAIVVDGGMGIIEAILIRDNAGVPVLLHGRHERWPEDRSIPCDTTGEEAVAAVERAVEAAREQAASGKKDGSKSWGRHTLV